ncbi:glycosyltransferase family 4 protein [bacterium]|nr:glycosyltransferase family 4 protein [bacterium]
MKILMIAPQPIFEPRGTPLSVVGRLKSLSDMGHEVDLLTYPIGEDVQFPGLHLMRTLPVPGIRKIKIGPSIKKIPLDFLLINKTFGRLVAGKYDLIHTHEEAGFWGTLFSRWFGIPHLYDMHSSLPQQLSNFKFSNSKLLKKTFDVLENWVLKKSESIITICPDLRDHVLTVVPEKGSELIENVVDYGMVFGEEDRSEAIRQELNLDGKTVALYTGTFETYQGLDMLIQSARLALAEDEKLIFVLVGGHGDQVDYYKKMAEEAGVLDRMIFVGQVRPNEVNSYIRVADILLSPRTRGTNTPLKIYAYFRSGVPMVATRLWTHTQVMDDSVAMLVEPDPQSYAEGILTLIGDSQLRNKISKAAVALAESQFSYVAYKAKFTRALNRAVGKEV